MYSYIQAVMAGLIIGNEDGVIQNKLSIYYMTL